LNEGQIQISNDMLIDKISEEYPEIAMQALISYQSTVKHTMEKIAKATVMEFSVMPL
jgi:predicted RNase H-like nuclease